MAIYKITKKEFDKIKHDQEWGIHQCLTFKRGKDYMKCDILGVPGLREIARYNAAKAKVERDQLDLLGFKNPANL